MFGTGCDAAMQREMEVLFRPEANPLLIRQSYLVNAFGPQLFRFFR